MSLRCGFRCALQKLIFEIEVRYEQLHERGCIDASVGNSRSGCTRQVMHNCGDGGQLLGGGSRLDFAPFERWREGSALSHPNNLRQNGFADRWKTAMNQQVGRIEQVDD